MNKNRMVIKKTLTEREKARKNAKEMAKKLKKTEWVIKWQKIERRE